MPQSDNLGHDVIYIKVPDRLISQLGQVSQEDKSVTETLYAQLEMMTQDVIREYISRHRERKSIENNLDLFSG